MAFTTRMMRGFGSSTSTHAQLQSRISRISQHVSNFSHFNASPYPAKFNVSFGVSYASCRRIFSADDDHPKSLRSFCESFLKARKTTPAKLEEKYEIIAEFVVEVERKSGVPRLEIDYSIRRRILELETLLAPELDDPATVVDDPDKLPLSYLYYWLYTEEKWAMILQKKDDPRVKQLLELIEKAEISQDVFRQSLGQFSLGPSKCNERYTRPLSEFDLDEIESYLQNRFSDNPAHIIFDIKSITHVLMKME